MKRKPKTILDQDDVLDLLRSEVAKAGSQKKWAKENGVNRPVVCRALGGSGTLQDKILKALGLKKIDDYPWE